MKTDATAGSKVGKILAIVLIIIFWPIGIFVLWKSKKYSSRTKAIVTGVIAVLLLFVFVQQLRGKKTIDEAHQLWDSGNKAEAVMKYKEVINSDMTVIDREERSTVFQRVIEFDVEQGNYTPARGFIKMAMDRNIPLSFASAEASGLLSEIKQAMLAERAKFEHHIGAVWDTDHLLYQMGDHMINTMNDVLKDDELKNVIISIKYTTESTDGEKMDVASFRIDPKQWASESPHLTTNPSEVWKLFQRYQHFFNPHFGTELNKKIREALRE